jgi:hypothetical protein
MIYFKELCLHGYESARFGSKSTTPFVNVENKSSKAKSKPHAKMATT